MLNSVKNSLTYALRRQLLVLYACLFLGLYLVSSRIVIPLANPWVPRIRILAGLLLSIASLTAIFHNVIVDLTE